MGTSFGNYKCRDGVYRQISSEFIDAEENFPMSIRVIKTKKIKTKNKKRLQQKKNQ